MFDCRQNVGTFDRLVRAVLGAGLIGLSLSPQLLQANLSGIPALISVPLLLSAIFAWDVIYAITGLSTCPRTHNVSQGIDSKTDSLDPAVFYQGRQDRRRNPERVKPIAIKEILG